MEDLFNQIKNLMELGYTRTEACAKLKIDRNLIYRKFNSEQRRIIDEVYFSHSNGSTATQSYCKLRNIE
jgi:hypothetical protein